ncbi:OmpW family outer membrane protein [Candidatus Sarmatiella mevalonica]|uniref:OmpW family outer membrane protein n=1 Tax=Candidatus Sarmatiella mevalonica TaxID=2770581 RepID=UPI00192346C4|nr:OmpW family outer membrane protein [Candidatus Sarmatiella mevalonica]
MLLTTIKASCSAQGITKQDAALPIKKTTQAQKSELSRKDGFYELNSSRLDLLPDVNLTQEPTLSEPEYVNKQISAKQNQEKNNKELECDAYKDLGLLFTTRLYTALFKNNLVLSLPSMDAARMNINKFATTGYGIETSTCILFNKYLGMEVGVSFALSSINKDLINKIIFQETSKEKSMNFYMIPFYDTLKVYPFGQNSFKPYVGFGVYGAYLSATNKYVRMSGAFGWVAQVGIDYKINKFNFNLDVKRYQMNAKVQYTNFENKITAKSNLNPVTIALGLAFSL